MSSLGTVMVTLRLLAKYDMFLPCDHKGHRALCRLASWKTFSRFVWLFWLGISITLYLLITGYLCLPWGSLSQISCSVVHHRELGIFSGVQASRLPPTRERRLVESSVFSQSSPAPFHSCVLHLGHQQPSLPLTLQVRVLTALSCYYSLSFLPILPVLQIPCIQFLCDTHSSSLAPHWLATIL